MASYPVSIMKEYDFLLFFRSINCGRKLEVLRENAHYIFVGENIKYRGYRRYFYVPNVEEVEVLRHKITSKLLITTATCSAENIDGKIVSEMFFVVVDTSDSHVRKALDETFDKAKQLIENGEKFTVQFDLDQSIAAWYDQCLNYDNPSCEKISTSVGAGFYLLHENPPHPIPRRQKNMSDVELFFGLACFPCYLCYLYIRHLIDQLTYSPNGLLDDSSIVKIPTNFKVKDQYPSFVRRMEYIDFSMFHA
ncbi:uncharacterized protein LOC124453422 [Xenia sp. Carnegie-2017]|uniref:uncharacterized protein LOC124453422 n=1 Tax=Xenia sp. Carnegie-2017 TaxID=2897299 RepID=UPI001F03C82A|nr:uncharacterized protein LOC124453422 [Xenia sp. Carnegie-2017]